MNETEKLLKHIRELNIPMKPEILKVREIMLIKINKKQKETIEIFKQLLKQRVSDYKIAGFKTGYIESSNKSKIRILNFIEKEKRFPKRNAKTKREKSLGSRFENFIAKNCRSFDSDFRDLIILLGRKSNNKRKHNIKKYRQEIINFLKTHNRVPSTNRNNKTIEGEATLRSKLDYYTKDRNDMHLLKEIYKYDKCHRSGISVKLRPFININISVGQPIVKFLKGSN